MHWWWDNGWGGPELLGGNPPGSVSAVSWGPGRLDIFSIEAVDASGGEGQLSHWWFDNGWGQPELLGANLEANGPPWVPGVSAVSWTFGRLDVLGIDRNSDGLAHWWFDNGWGGPESLGGNLGSIPGVVSWAPNRLDVFAADATTSQLAHWWWDNGWGGPELLGGNLPSSPSGIGSGSVFPPSAVSWAPNRLDVFGIDADTSQLVHWWWDNGWGGPELLGGNLASAPSAVSWGPNRLDIFGIDADTNQLVHWWWDNGWGGPELLSGNVTYGVSAVSWASGRLDVFGIDSSSGHGGELLHWWWPD